MAGTEINVPLIHGLKIGEAVCKDAKLREATAGDVLDAQEAAERLMMVPTQNGIEPMLVVSPSRVGVEVLRRQIVSIGDVSGPLDLKLMHRLHPEDLNLLLAKSEQLDGAAVAQTQEGTTQRGRGDSDRPASDGADVGDRNTHGVE
ncbi:phage tail assembly protein [Vreelandella maris]|uniref:Phage tail assembly protein n=1 Tax=Vreelandella maris TaxID=2729617 RepID=A0A7Y6V9J1_9GAMM|nr:phage tail assembly protein [Halomonas maris]NVF15012.1 phage tail assembly protein [Halomonas maris]